MPRDISQRDLMQMQGNQQLIAMATQLAIASKQAQIERERTAAQVRLGERGFEIEEGRALAIREEARENRNFQLKLANKASVIEDKRFAATTEAQRRSYDLQKSALESSQQNTAMSRASLMMQAYTASTAGSRAYRVRQEAGLDERSISEATHAIQQWRHFPDMASNIATNVRGAAYHGDEPTETATKLFNWYRSDLRNHLKAQGFSEGTIGAAMADFSPRMADKVSFSLSETPVAQRDIITRASQALGAQVPIVGRYLGSATFVDKDQVDLALAMLVEGDVSRHSATVRRVEQEAQRGGDPRTQAMLLSLLKGSWPKDIPFPASPGVTPTRRGPVPSPETRR